MDNIPVFSTENGVGSLVLREIPYQEIAYIIIRSTQEPELFLKECVDFCVQVGAKKIFASGSSFLEKYPFHTAIWSMKRPLDGIGDTDAYLFPVTEATVEKWRTIYNDRMANVANAAWYAWTDGKRLVKEGNGYFVHKDGQLLGIGIASQETIDAIISVVPGAGRDVLCALCHALSGDAVCLQVASANLRAVRLYEKMGFIKTEEVSSWYQIL